MTADIGALVGGKRAALADKSSKKLRSKSIGPGGLDALRDSTGNRRKSVITPSRPPPRSILKPTMPPLRDIPARKPSPKKTSPATHSSDRMNFNISGPAISGTENLANPFQVGENEAVTQTRIALRTEEEQLAAAREREEKERQELENEANARREARRKSLANRRVSFAPEATLHTWDVVVEYQDSTTSSNSTSSTRRASSVAGNAVASPHPNRVAHHESDASEPPSTPPEEAEEDTITASPAHQRQLHQKKRRRSSAIPPMDFNNPNNDGFSSSPFSGSSVGDADETIEADGDEESNSNSDSDGDEETMMSIDGVDTTEMSVATTKSPLSDSSGRLEQSLKLAARQAGTRGIEFDEYGEDGEDGLAEDEEVLASFAPFTKSASLKNLESKLDQENVNPFSPASGYGVRHGEGQQDGDELTMEVTHAVGGIIPSQQDEEEDMSMDVTRSFGGIVSNEAPKAADSRRKSTPSGRRQSTRRRSSGVSSRGDETMDLTTAVGGIQPADDDTASKDDEEMTMEFTSVVGGVLAPGNTWTASRRKSAASQGQRQSIRNRQSLDSAVEDDTMDITAAIGGIIPPESETMATEVDATVGIELTTAVGGILPQTSPANRMEAKAVMEMEADLASSPFQADVVAESPLKVVAPVHAVASETGSPSLAAFRGKGLRRSVDAQKSVIPKPRINDGTPVKKSVTPPKQLTPQPMRPTTPSKTPPSKNIAMRTSSPKRLFKNESKASSIPKSSATKENKIRNKLFQNDNGTGIPAPSFVLTPQRRRSSGVGIDRVGLGSPRVAELLDRRGSIGEEASSFVPSQLDNAGRGVRFEDPRVLEREVEMEHEVDQADNGDETTTLKEMIQSMSPKKKPLKGRKSLHIGAAKGLLGKRPIELDEDDEEEENDGVKRLRGHEGSPVKKVKLQGPPSKEDTTGHLTLATPRNLEQSSLAPGTAFSPVKGPSRAHDQPREVDTTITFTGSFPSLDAIENLGTDDSLSDDRIQLQDFLNMTSIRFMELTTTKRRHTIVPKEPNQRDSMQGEAAYSLEDCVAAGAATVPMLELFQHACYELKNYISEGRKTVREIETETFEENPPLFREYISASPDVKVIMDNQLKNVKTHARLLSKGMWYEWRMTLLATLKDGLVKTADGMRQDGKILDRQLALLDTVLPNFVRQAQQLENEEADLRSAADELANCDQAELSEARQKLIAVDADIDAKQNMIDELRKQLQGKEAEIATSTERKNFCLNEIREAEKIREDCRGWSSMEISLLKEKADKLEREHGWAITGVSGTTTSMTYRREIELVFDAASFSNGTHTKKSPNSSVDLWYIAATRESCPVPLTPELDFFLKNVRDHVRGLPQGQTTIRTLLREVSAAWNKANAIANSIRLLRASCPTEITKASDNSILVKPTLLIAPLATKVEITFQLTCHSSVDGINVSISSSAAVVYGERFNEQKMGEFLLSRCGNHIEEEGQATKVSWGAAVAELGEKLLARGRK